MSLRNLWILCIASLFLVLHDRIPGIRLYETQSGLIGLVVCAVIAGRSLRKAEDKSQYRWIMILSIGTIILLGVFIAYVLTSLDGSIFRFR